MSTFLGPIHYWLFNKIRLVETREKEIVKAVGNLFGKGAVKRITEVTSKYPPYFDNTPLEELIGNSSIHAFLADTIRRVELREAEVLGVLMENYGRRAEELALEVSYNHGLVNGRIALKEYEIDDPTAESLYKTLRDYFLDGMPCDHVVEIQQVSERELIERHSECLHSDYWKEAGVSQRFMCTYLCKWVDGFIDGTGSGVHVRKRSIVNGDTFCEDIYKVRS